MEENGVYSLWDFPMRQKLQKSSLHLLEIWIWQLFKTNLAILKLVWPNLERYKEIILLHLEHILLDSTKGYNHVSWKETMLCIKNRRLVDWDWEFRNHLLKSIQAIVIKKSFKKDFLRNLTFNIVVIRVKLEENVIVLSKLWHIQKISSNSGYMEYTLKREDTAKCKFWLKFKRAHKFNS